MIEVHDDTSWCLNCEKQIAPKRWTVAVDSASSSKPSQLSSAGDSRRQKNIHGTHDRKHTQDNSIASSSTVKVTSQKTRLVIDQGPSPLYCSDECLKKSMYGSTDEFFAQHDPSYGQHSPSHPNARHRQLFYFDLSSQTESESSLSSIESESSTSTSSVCARDTALEEDHNSSMATIAAMYGFPESPSFYTLSSRTRGKQKISCSAPSDYQSGVMMASRRMEQAFSQAGTVKTGLSNQLQAHQAIPGWTDGSDAWRSSTYSFSSATPGVVDPGEETRPNPYKSVSASAHRSQAAMSTLGQGKTNRGLNRNTVQKSLEKEDLYANYPMFSSKRAESRMLPQSGSSPRSGTDLGPKQRSRRSLVKAGAEGMLLVPDIPMKPFQTPSKSKNASVAQSLPSNHTIRTKRPGSLTQLLSITSIATPNALPDGVSVQPNTSGAYFGHL